MLLFLAASNRRNSGIPATETIFKKAEQSPHPRIPTGLARMPLIKNLASIGYDQVAANRRLLVGPATRLFWLKTTVIVAFCVGLLMSVRLWARRKFKSMRHQTKGARDWFD